MWFEYFTERISGSNADFANTKPAWANLEIRARREGAKHAAFAKYAYDAQR
jgi:hypothetical protein